MRPPVPEVLDVKLVEYVKEVFHKADADGGGDLDEEEFVQSFTGRLRTDEGSDAARLSACSHLCIVHLRSNLACAGVAPIFQ
jgi:hypothetical protein